MESKLLLLGLASGLALLGAQAQAAIYLSHAGLPVDDIDGVRGIADLETAPNTVLNFDVVYDSDRIGADTTGGTAGGVDWSFTFALTDAVETTFDTLGVLPSGALMGAIDPVHYSLVNDGTTATLTYRLLQDLADDTVLARLSFLTGTFIGVTPHDDVDDVILTSAGISVFDKVYFEDNFPSPDADGYAAQSPLDLQRVPAPAAALLLPVALAGLGVAGRRRRG